MIGQPDPGAGLPDDLVALIEFVTAPLGDISQQIVRQATAATVLSASATMLDVEVPPHMPGVPLTDGPTPIRALVYKGTSLVGELLVWVRGGRLVGLEQAWFTDEPPTAWPERDQVLVT